MLKILPLTGSHDRSRFDCGKVALDDWLARTARQHQEKDISQTFVAVDPESPRRILGYYALSACELSTGNLPPEIGARLPRQTGAVRLGRLAVDLSVQGQGLGELLLLNAITRSCAVREEIGLFALFVDAKDDEAARFYAKYGFVALPASPLTLVLPLKRVCAGRGKVREDDAG